MVLSQKLNRCRSQVECDARTLDDRSCSASKECVFRSCAFMPGTGCVGFLLFVGELSVRELGLLHGGVTKFEDIVVPVRHVARRGSTIKSVLP